MESNTAGEGDDVQQELVQVRCHCTLIDANPLHTPGGREGGRATPRAAASTQSRIPPSATYRTAPTAAHPANRAVAPRGPRQPTAAPSRAAQTRGSNARPLRSARTLSIAPTSQRRSSNVAAKTGRPASPAAPTASAALGPTASKSHGLLHTPLEVGQRGGGGGRVRERERER